MKRREKREIERGTDTLRTFLPVLQPAMDVYSLGVLLFVMLVGRKPWDAQHSHTLAYAVLRTREAPGLHDPLFLGLSAPAQQLLAWMLSEDSSRRPTAQQVLGHSWVLQGGVCKVRGVCAEHTESSDKSAAPVVTHFNGAKLAMHQAECCATRM